MSENKSSHGIGFLGLLQIALIVLKICGVIKRSWVMVFIPIYIWLFFLIFVCLVVIVYDKVMQGK